MVHKRGAGATAGPAITVFAAIGKNLSLVHSRRFG
jgi:hypothetical protein